MLEQAIGKTAGRGAHVGTGIPENIHFESLQGSLELFPARET
jgi:hypothetical protein